MPYSVKGFFEINEDMVQILLMLEVLFTQDSKVLCSELFTLHSMLKYIVLDNKFFKIKKEHYSDNKGAFH